MSAAAVQPLKPRETRMAAFRPRCWIPAAQLLTDAIAVEIALLAGVLIRVALTPWFSVSLASEQVQGIALGLLVIPCAYLLAGLYPGYGLSSVERLRRRFRASFYVFSGLIAWGYLVHRERWSRGVLLATLLFILLLSPIVERLLIRLFVYLNLWGASVVVFGTRESGRRITRQMRRQRALGLVPVALIEIDGTELWTGDALGAVADVHLRSRGLGPARVAVVAMPAVDEQRRSALLAALPFRCIIVIAEIAQIQTQSITTVDIGGVLGLALNRNLLVPWNCWLKRALDIGLGSLLLLASAPLLAICAAWIRCSSAGPALYSQNRSGLGNRTIRIWKLRTMRANADQLLSECLAMDFTLKCEWERFLKLRRDPRVLPGVGRILRRTSLDELPQLWNVVAGNMSLVGPRPLPSYHLERFDPEFRSLRESVRPGITGLWQVSARSDGDLAAQRALDTYYIRNWSLWLDLEICIRTVYAVLRGRGAY